MQINDTTAYRVMTEQDVIAAHLDLRDRQVLELGCGRAWMTRLLAREFHPARVVATEVDRVQHAKNLQITDLPGVQFRYGGAEHIDAEDGEFDTVLMFKSLHHVPRDLLDQALGEIHRVLRPGGVAYFSEPVYWGDFNAILSLFNDERRVRELAFDSLRRAVDEGRFTLQAEVFFQVPGTYDSWQAFEERFIHVTHTEHRIAPELYRRIQAAFMAHMTPNGAHFLKPHRVDILRRAA